MTGEGMVTVSLLCLNKIKWNKIFLIEYHITNWLQFSPSSVCWLNHVLQMRSFVIGKENQLNVYDHVKTSVFQPANISCQNDRSCFFVEISCNLIIKVYYRFSSIKTQEHQDLVLCKLIYKEISKSLILGEGKGECWGLLFYSRTTYTIPRR